MYDKWFQHLEKGKLADAVFLDTSAGFDVINHFLLLKKLLSMGLVKKQFFGLAVVLQGKVSVLKSNKKCLMH